MQLNRLLLSRTRIPQVGGEQRGNFTGRLQDMGSRLIDTYAVALPALELSGGCTAILWGGWLLSHGGLFLRYRIFFAPMALVARPWIWGLVVLSLGVFQWWATLTGIHRWRQVGCFLACGGWVGLGVAYILGDPQAVGIPWMFQQAAQAAGNFLLLEGHNRRGRSNGGTR